MLFCQLGRAHSLREICQGLAASEGKLKHLGVPTAPSRSTLAYANQHRDRNPTVWLREPKKRYVYNPDLDPLVQAIARDNEYDERMKRRRQLECEQGSLPEANTAASEVDEQE